LNYNKNKDKENKDVYKDIYHEKLILEKELDQLNQQEQE